MQAWGESISGCRVSVARAASDVESTVVLDIVFRNDGSSMVNFPRMSLWFDYDFTVVSESGSSVPMTPFGEQEHRNKTMGGASAVAEVAPGKAYRCSVEISRLYELNRPGSYIIQASKAFRDAATSQFVTASSNKLTVQIARR
jgi:hypothetical protein